MCYTLHDADYECKYIYDLQAAAATSGMRQLRLQQRHRRNNANDGPKTMLKERRARDHFSFRFERIVVARALFHISYTLFIFLLHSLARSFIVCSLFIRFIDSMHTVQRAHEVLVERSVHKLKKNRKQNNKK